MSKLTDFTQEQLSQITALVGNTKEVAQLNEDGLYALRATSKLLVREDLGDYKTQLRAKQDEILNELPF